MAAENAEKVLRRMLIFEVSVFSVAKSSGGENRLAAKEHKERKRRRGEGDWSMRSMRSLAAKVQGLERGESGRARRCWPNGRADLGGTGDWPQRTQRTKRKLFIRMPIFEVSVFSVAKNSDGENQLAAKERRERKEGTRSGARREGPGTRSSRPTTWRGGWARARPRRRLRKNEPRDGNDRM